MGSGWAHSELRLDYGKCTLCGGMASRTAHTSAAMCGWEPLSPPPAQCTLVIVIHKQHGSEPGSKERHGVIRYLELIYVCKVRFRPDASPLQIMLKVWMEKTAVPQAQPPKEMMTIGQFCHTMVILSLRNSTSALSTPARLIWIKSLESDGPPHP